MCVHRLGFGAMRITGALVQLKDQGKIRHIGVSNVTEAQLVSRSG